MDDDGDQDIVGACMDRVIVSLNDGTGHFTQAEEIIQDGSFAATVGDVNGDGLPDIVWAPPVGSGGGDTDELIVSLNVLANDAPVVDLNGTGATGQDYATTYTEGGTPTLIASSGLLIADDDSTHLYSLTITLTNPQPGDFMTLGTIPESIAVPFGSPDKYILNLRAPISDYEAALSEITFANDSGAPSTIDRTITIVASDGDKVSSVVTTTIQVVAVHSPVAITSNGSGPSATVASAENDAGVTDVDAEDADSVPTFSIVGGEDSAKFTIDPTTGVLAFVASPDFENPTDVGRNNTYKVTVRASDGVNHDDQALTVIVTNLLEPPTAGNDKFIGTSGPDVMRGGLGNDTLTGDAGADGFLFDTKPGKSNVDHLTDFAPKTDKIQLDDDIFTSFTAGKVSALARMLLGEDATFAKSGPNLAKNAFLSGKKVTQAADTDDRILYNQTTGALYYDKDGKGASKAVQFAILDGSPDNLSHKDFAIVA